MDRWFTREQIEEAEVKTQGILGHANILSVLERMDMFSRRNGPRWISAFQLTECERELIEDYCGIRGVKTPIIKKKNQ